MKNQQARCSLMRTVAGLLLALLSVTPAFAHTGAGGLAGGFLPGFLHPLSGVDHMLAMVAVGLWGAILGPPALWILPITFPLIMTLGAVYGILGWPLAHVELGIVLSVILLGLVIAVKFKPNAVVATLIVSGFAVFHGYAHGLELPGSANAVGYSAGFVVSTGMLHLCGILIGLIHRFSFGERLLRFGGLAICLGGVYLLLV